MRHSSSQHLAALLSDVILALALLPMALGNMHTQPLKRCLLLFIFLSLSVLFAGCGGSGGQNFKANPSANDSTNINSNANSETEDTTDNPETAAGVQFSPADITLSWQIPLSREDGSALPISAIAGYEISYENSRNQTTVITINDAEANKYKINDLPADNYQFAVFAFDTDNAVSEPSPLASIQRSDFPRL